MARADLINVFEVFLPQLLLYPNPTDPLNGEAAALLMREPQVYEQRVKGEHCFRTCLLASSSTHIFASLTLVQFLSEQGFYGRVSFAIIEKLMVACCACVRAHADYVQRYALPEMVLGKAGIAAAANAAVQRSAGADGSSDGGGGAGGGDGGGAGGEESDGFLSSSDDEDMD